MGNPSSVRRVFYSNHRVLLDSLQFGQSFLIVMHLEGSIRIFAMATVNYSIVNSWGAGFTAEMKVKTEDAGLDGWTVSFDAPFTIINICWIH